MTTRGEVERLIADDAGLAAILEHVRERSTDDPGHDLDHALRVATWTLRLSHDSADPRLAVAAALLHDIVNLPKSSPDRARAAELSAEHARRVLAENGFDHEQRESIARAIEDHSFSRGVRPRSPLGKALQDADRLEALGALGLMRCISTGSRMGADYFDPADPWAERRELDDRGHSVDHFFTKLLALPASMQTEAGRLEAERRAAFLRCFLEQLSRELEVPLPGWK